MHAFYEDEEFTRLLLGSKDVASVGYKICQRKRLLCDMKELFVEFRNLNSNVKVGFSKFCFLQPKWCVLLGSSGSYAVCMCVCVCAFHHSAKLMATDYQWEYKEIMQVIVCDTSSKTCLVHQCSNCPGKNTLVSRLHNKQNA